MSGASLTIDDVKRIDRDLFERPGWRVYPPIYSDGYFVVSRTQDTSMGLKKDYVVYRVQAGSTTLVQTGYRSIGSARNAISRFLGSRR